HDPVGQPQGSRPHPASGWGCGAGRHPPKGSKPQPASADALQSEDTSDQNESSSPDEPRRDAVTTTRTRVRRMGKSPGAAPAAGLRGSPGPRPSSRMVP